MKETTMTQAEAKARHSLAPTAGSATPFLDAVQDIRTLHDDAVIKTTRLLESRGWRYTCQTPGCVWMFEKQIDGRIVLTDQETALRIEVENTTEQYEDLGG